MIREVIRMKVNDLYISNSQISQGLGKSGAKLSIRKALCIVDFVNIIIDGIRNPGSTYLRSRRMAKNFSLTMPKKPDIIDKEAGEIKAVEVFVVKNSIKTNSLNALG